MVSAIACQFDDLYLFWKFCSSFLELTVDGTPWFFTTFYNLFSQEENQRQLFRKIRMGEFEFFQEDWEDISEPAKDMISKLLVVDPSRRIKAQAALQHEWICKVDDEDLSARSLSSSLDSLRSSLKSIQTEEGYTAEWLIEGREMIE